METILMYSVVDADTGKVLKTYNNQAPATSWAKGFSGRRGGSTTERKLLVVEQTYVNQSACVVRAVDQGKVVKCS